MAQQEVSFGDLEVGAVFTWRGTVYEKQPMRFEGRYGWVNAAGPAFYDGDTGERAFYDSQLVSCGGQCQPIKNERPKVLTLGRS